ncbi:MAG: SDR family oxidoreductase [Gemmatimonadota bacterium]
MIVVTGATGTIGRELVRLLAEGGRQVRAVTREPAGRPDLPGVDWVRGDLADRAGLAPVLEGASRLFLLTGNQDDMVRLQKNAVQAAGVAGVEAVVKLSALGASDHSKSLIGLWHHNVEQALRESGMAWTILRPHVFAQNLLSPVVFDRAAGRVYSASGDGAVPFIDTRDIAAVAAAVLTEDGHDGRTYTLTGPDAISYRQATEILGRVLERPLAYVAETLDEAWTRRRAAGQPAWLVAAQLALAEYQRAGAATAQTTDTVQRVTGRPARTLEAFARDYAQELGA